MLKKTTKKSAKKTTNKSLAKSLTKKSMLLKKKSLKPDLSFLFDIESILKNTPNKDKLSVTLKHQPIKGNSLFAKKPINKGDLIAYYKMKAYTSNDISTDYDKKTLQKMCTEFDIPYPTNASKCQLKELLEINFSTLSLKGRGIDTPFKDMYNFTIENKYGKFNKHLIGDLYSGSLPPPKNNIPYWAYFANEPFQGVQITNAIMDYQIHENFTKKDRTSLKEGDTFTYALFATRQIDAGEEIVWNYGADYGRSYEAGKC
jgi:hypothetical protein